MLHRRHIFAGEKRGRCVGPTKRGKGTKIMGLADRNGLPISLGVNSASPAEVTLAKELILKRFVKPMPVRVIGDKAYDSDGLDQELLKHGVRIISPNRSNRRTNTQDGRELRRYKRRWKIERFWAWLFSFRRVVVRYERYIENYLCFVQLASAQILMRRLVSG